MKQVSKVDIFFNQWKKNMVRYGLRAGLGELFVNDAGTSALYQQGNFIFLAGQVDSVFWQDYNKEYGLDYKIIISEELPWQDFLRGQSYLNPFTRYAFSDQTDFDLVRLEEWKSSLQSGYQLVLIDENRYRQLGKEEWSQDLQGEFASFDEFQQAGGFGFVVLSGGDIIAAVSSGLVYQDAIEIEIATKPTYQRQGLAKVLGATVILEAQKRSVFPLWDAHNEASKKVALALGYQLIGPYVAFEER